MFQPGDYIKINIEYSLDWLAGKVGRIQRVPPQSQYIEVIIHGSKTRWVFQPEDIEPFDVGVSNVTTG
jgi:hypothetical protein